MNILEHRAVDLAVVDYLWVRPNEDFSFYMNFGQDVSGWTFKLLYSEHKWPYMPYSYDILVPGSIDSGFTFTDTAQGMVGAILNLTIPEAQINNWIDRTLDLRLQVNDGANTWIASDRTLTVTQGD